MGDAVVSTLVTEVVGRLTSVAVKEFGLVWGFKDDVFALKKDFEEIGAVLQDAENKRITENAIELWLKRLKLVSLEVENVLNEISTEAMLQSLYKKRGIKYRVRAFFSSNHNQLLFRVRLAHKVKALRRNVNALASRRFELRLTTLAAKSNPCDARVEVAMPDRETSSLIGSSPIFGGEEETEMVVEKICNEDIGRDEDDDTIRVFGIWGMGGMGKTTLAQLLYNHEMVKECFKLRFWVYVSEKFQVTEIIKKVITLIDESECKLTELEMLQKSLQSKLSRKKFLIVLDDVWIEDAQKADWDKLSNTLNCGSKESIVVMTTRSETTSRMMAKVPVLQHNVAGLSKDDSWLLFEKLAFAQGRQGDGKSQLEPIGREIVEKCEGLPLALKTLGSLMWSKLYRSDWKSVRDSNIWELQENDILPSLKLSYDNLSPHLRRCFAYCCLFPKGYKMKKDEVIHLWVANGFIPPRRETSLYLLGEEIFTCLIWRSFFLQTKYFDHTDSYKMHDLMHDMARYVMKDDILVVDRVEEYRDEVDRDDVLHLSLLHPNFLFSPTIIKKLTSLRSMFVFGEMSENHIRQIVTHVNLRVLYLRGTMITLPELIYKLKHLKYLNLSRCAYIELLPDSVVYLQNLQVLLLSCRSLSKLPKGLGYMTNLECLNIRGCSSLLHLPLGIKEVTKLRILPRFPVGNNIGAQIGELRDHNNLEGTLAISGLRNVRGISEAKSANLKGKRNLLILQLDWEKSSKEDKERETHAYDEEVLEGLEPNPCLERLKILHYSGKIISPSWMVKLKYLVEIQFSDCENCERIPLLGKLPNLRLLELRKMGSLKSFHNDDIGNTNMFPCLQELTVSHCNSLLSLPSYLPKLKVLDLEECYKLASLPDGIIKDLNKLRLHTCVHLCTRYKEGSGRDWPKISHIPNIFIFYIGIEERIRGQLNATRAQMRFIDGVNNRNAT